MKTSVINTCFLIVAALLSCTEQEELNKTITVKNTLNVPRAFETVEIHKTDLELGESQNFEQLAIRDLKTKTLVISQFVDSDHDGHADLLLFQPKIDANSEKQYELFKVNHPLKQDTATVCYSRFVPERTDDYAWENNKVAFRTFGPTAQKMVEEKIKGGTLSSGIDAWLKKVEYPVINKWYKKTTTGKGSYHKDTGEGLDNFHVGPSRGIGGTAVKHDSIYYISENFTDWKTITNGPIRTSFILQYTNWDANGKTITEEKHISLDYGSNLSRFEIHVTGTDELWAGLTLHDNKGKITQNPAKGWISYWEPHDGSELGTAIIAPKGYMIGSDYYLTPQKDLSNLYAHLKVKNNKVVYYAGFAWKESKQYPSKSSWENYINNFSNKLNNPIKITVE